MSGKDTKFVVIDSNVFQHFSSNQELSDQIIQQLSEAIQSGYTLSMSDFTLFEMIDGTSTEREIKISSAMNGIKRFRVNKKVLLTAPHLGCLYQEDKHTIGDAGDKIIGATAILTKSLIYTFNGRDFPIPFFRPIAERYARYKNGGVNSVLVSYFLEPNIPLINERYNPRETKGKTLVKKKK